MTTPPAGAAVAAAEAERAGVARATMRALWGLESPWVRDFDDPRLEWRRLFSEALGTFLLVTVGVGGAMVAEVSHQVSRTAAVTAPGLMVVTIVLFMGAVSGAHLNPIVSFAFALRGDFPWRRVPGYVVVQILAATLACLALRALLGVHAELGLTAPGQAFTDAQAFGVECLGTFGLVSTILVTASRAQNVGPLSAVAVGGYVVLTGLWSGPVGGGVMNPARAFGPALVTGHWSHYWLYVAGPLVGAVAAVGAAWVLRGPGGDTGGVLAAQGALR